jgi:hypothetical protein
LRPNSDGLANTPDDDRFRLPYPTPCPAQHRIYPRGRGCCHRAWIGPVDRRPRIVYRRTPENIARLAACLGSCHPYLRGAPPGLPFRLDAETIQRGLNFTLTTDLGALDLFGEIPGGGGYEDLQHDAIELKLFGVTCRCLGLRRLIEVKRAAGRPRDLEVIAELQALLDENEGQFPAPSDPSH